jgi:hypothetical protein
MPSLASGSQGRRRLDVEVAVPARGRRDLSRCGRGSDGDTGCAGSTKRGAAVAVAELPAAPMLPRSVMVCGVGCVRRRGEPRTASRGPHPLFIALRDGGPPTMDWLGAPDQDAVSSPLRPLGRNGEEIELTVTVNPGGVLGPMIPPTINATMSVLLRLLQGKA